MLIGRGGDRCAAGLEARHPGLRGRLAATGGLPPADVSRHLQACDLVILPYIDGVNTRRTTAMAALANGLPVATILGANTDPIWVESGAVALAPVDEPGSLAARAEELLADPDRRAALGRPAGHVRRAFAIERTVAALRAGDAGSEGIEPSAAGRYTGKGSDPDPGRTSS